MNNADKILVKLLRLAFRKTKLLRPRLYTFYYRHLFASFGDYSKVIGSIVVYGPENISVGSHCTLNEGVILVGRDKITIGDHVRISPRVIINTGGLEFNNPSLPLLHKQSPVVIEDGVWIASGVIIIPGITIGKRSIVAAGAVVINDVRPFKIVGGVPAREISEIHISEPIGNPG
jgi:maltose O-acetyltransferase